MKSVELPDLKAKLEPPWDELRERRVLGAVLEKRRGSRAPRRVRVLVPVAAALVLAAAAVLLVVRPWIATPRPVASEPAPTESTMALADGSMAVLLANAAVEIQEQRPDRVQLLQRRGSVRYEVRPDASREFVVRAADAVVRVRGTIFVVDVRDGAVEVRVQRGRVEVEHAGSKRDLVVGESLRVPTGQASAPGSSPDDNPFAAPIPSASETAEAGPSEPVVPSASSLQATADAARIRGDNAQAASALERLVALHPRDPAVPDALFSLGRVERARRNLPASGRAFERCYTASPGGPLAQDALAEAAQSWANAGNDEAARADAVNYLKRWPHGGAANKMKAIAGP
ncbi:MAG TPA: FecR domain-containing protein [Polyangiaceae bacterium]|jgi:transmembrane sensor